MASRFAPQPAVRRGQKARLALAGPAGAGKTWTGLEAAFALAEGEPVLVIDTERASASLYADEFPAFDVIDWSPPYNPRELAAIVTEQAPRYGVIVVDSLSHFWEGEGGTRDIVDAAASRAKGNSFAGWKEGTPAQNDMVAGLLGAPCHVIVTMRSKTAYVLEQDDRGKQVPRKVGMEPIQRAGIEYEWTVAAEVDREHAVTVDKTRCSLLADKTFKAGHTVELARQLGDWLKTAKPPVAAASPEEHEVIHNRIAVLTDDQKRTVQEWWQSQRLPSIKSHDALDADQALQVMDFLDTVDSGSDGGPAPDAPPALSQQEVEPDPESMADALPVEEARTRARAATRGA